MISKEKALQQKSSNVRCWDVCFESECVLSSKIVLLWLCKLQFPHQQYLLFMLLNFSRKFLCLFLSLTFPFSLLSLIVFAKVNVDAKCRKQTLKRRWPLHIVDDIFQKQKLYLLHCRKVQPQFPPSGEFLLLWEIEGHFWTCISAGQRATINGLRHGKKRKKEEKVLNSHANTLK